MKVISSLQSTSTLFLDSRPSRSFAARPCPAFIPANPRYGFSFSRPRQLHGTHQSLRFVQAFLVFTLRDGIRHNAGSSLHVRLLAFHQHGANHDARIEIAGEVRVKDRPALDSAPHRLAFFDDLHSPNFGRAGTSSGRGTGRGGIDRSELATQLSFHRRYPVPDVRGSPHEHSVSDFHP